MSGIPGLFASLRFKFTVLLAVFGGVLLLAAMVLLEQDIRRSLAEENIRKGVGIAQGVALNAEDPLLTGDDLYLFSAAKNAMKAPGVVYAVIAGEDGTVKAAADLRLVGHPFRLPPGAVPEASAEGFTVMRVPQEDGTVLDLAVPIFSVADSSLRLGEIHLGLSEKVIAEAIGKVRRRLAFLAAVALAVGSVGAFLLASFFVQPIHALVRGVRAIGEGRLEQRIELRRRDELGILTAAFNDMATSLREKEFIQNTFERYVSKQVARQILENRESIKLGGEEKEVSILFSDIRRFTAFAEQLSAPEMVEVLNEYFDCMVEIILRHGGMVDKFMGDAIMALFGAPLPLREAPLQAVRCARDMQEAMTALNRRRRANGKATFEMGIGIDTGPVVAGNIGSARRMEYTVIGDSVNVASRLEAIAGGGEILVSAATVEKIGDQIRFLPLPPVQLKGKSAPVPVFRLEG